jgi:DNA-binding MarR family transcriptional regulator
MDGPRSGLTAGCLTLSVITYTLFPMPTALQLEIKQTKPFGSIEEEVHLSLIRTAACLSHTFGEALKAHGITATQYNALRVLRGAGEAGLCRNEVRDRLVAPVPDATRLLDRLERLGLIERERGESDRRFVTTRITKAGLRLLAQLDDPVAALHRQQLAHMSKDDLRALVAILDRVRSRG